jgi:hypothetical protein
MRRYALVLRVQHDETGRIVGQIVAPGDERPVPFTSLDELWSSLLQCLHLPPIGMPQPPEPAGRQLSDDVE